jgi:hypothetical protein
MLSFMAVLAFCKLAMAQQTPKIEFEQTVRDFGNVRPFDTLTGSFKFKNTGSGVLKVQQPSSNCGCAVATLKKDTLDPGEIGEVNFTWKIGQSKGSLRRSIAVASNDLLTPQAILTIKANSEQLYKVTPASLMTNVPVGATQGDLSIEIARTDGKALGIERIATSQPWIVATIDPAVKPSEGAARIHIVMHGSGLPRRFGEFIHVYTADDSHGPVKVSIFGEIVGELIASPHKLFWSISDSPGEHRTAPSVRRLTIRSSTGKAFELKNGGSSIDELSVQFNKIEDGKAYQIVATLEKHPAKSLTGVITFETSVASHPKFEVPVEISLFHQSVNKVHDGASGARPAHESLSPAKTSFHTAGQ